MSRVESKPNVVLLGGRSLEEMSGLNKSHLSWLKGFIGAKEGQGYPVKYNGIPGFLYTKNYLHMGIENYPNPNWPENFHENTSLEDNYVLSLAKHHVAAMKRLHGVDGGVNSYGGEYLSHELYIFFPISYSNKKYDKVMDSLNFYFNHWVRGGSTEIAPADRKGYAVGVVGGTDTLFRALVASIRNPELINIPLISNLSYEPKLTNKGGNTS